MRKINNLNYHILQKRSLNLVSNSEGVKAPADKQGRTPMDFMYDSGIQENKKGTRISLANQGKQHIKRKQLYI